MRYKAFTLAEVLITLGIIGVVAAVTMPTVINNHQDAILKGQFKKAYSIMQQAYDKATSDLGYVPNCYYWVSGSEKYSEKCIERNENYDCIKYEYTSLVDGSVTYDRPLFKGGYRENCTELAEAVLNNLNIVKTCNNKAFENGCIPEYIGIEKIQKDENDKTEAEAMTSTAGCKGYRTTNIRNSNSAYVLADGQILISYAGGQFVPQLFLVDINGQKGPNKWGYDLFPFMLRGDVNKELTITGSGCEYTQKGGRRTAEMLQYVFNTGN